jgi:S1-C subfamily serine protease
LAASAGREQAAQISITSVQSEFADVAVGNPFGLGGTVTAGIVSARGRDIGAGPYDDYVQIDAPINKGNSWWSGVRRRGQCGDADRRLRRELR